jgi:hypothetical protein
MPGFRRILRDLQKQKNAAQPYVKKLDRAIEALQGLDKGRRRARRGAKRSAATIAKMRKAQRARRAKEKKGKTAKKVAPRPKAKAAKPAGQEQVAQS